MNAGNATDLLLGVPGCPDSLVLGSFAVWDSGGTLCLAPSGNGWIAAVDCDHRWGPTPVGSGIAEGPAGRAPGFRAFSPNPFRAETVALLTVASGADPARMVVALYDVGGRKVREMAAEAAAGRAYELHWDGRSQSGALVAPGIYFARVSVGSEVAHQGKLVYVR